MQTFFSLSTTVTTIVASYFAFVVPTAREGEDPPLILKATPAEKSKSAKVLADLQGRWVLKRYVPLGKEAAKASNEMVIVDNRVYYLDKGGQKLRAVLVVHPDRSAHLDYVTVMQPDEPGIETRIDLGLFRIENGSCTFCINATGAERPTQLAPGPRVMFSVWERVDTGTSKR